MKRIHSGWALGLVAVLAGAGEARSAGAPAGESASAAGVGGAVVRAIPAGVIPAADPSRPASEQSGGDGGTAGTPGDDGGGGVQDVGLTVIDFEDLRHDDAEIEFCGWYHSEDGFFITKGDNEEYDLATFGTQEARYPGSTALFNDNIGGVTYLYGPDQPYTLVSIGVSNLNNNGPTTVTFTGHRYDGSIVSKVCKTSGNDNRLETFNFDGWNNLFYVSWVQDSPYHQFDNIAVIQNTEALSFQDIEHADGGVVGYGPIYARGGFVLKQGDGEPYPLSTFGTQSPKYPGSTAMFDNTANGVVTLTCGDYQIEYAHPFNLHSIDLANLNLDGPTHVTFTGQRVDGNTVQDTFEIPGNSNVLHTYRFNNFQDLISVSWVQKAPYHQFDNIVVSRGRTVMDFEKLAINDNQAHAWGKHYREDGFQIDNSGPYGLYTFGAQADAWPGSTALFDESSGGRSTLTPINGKNFSVLSIDIAPLNGPGQTTVTFTGTKWETGSKVTQSFTTSGDGWRLETLTFDPLKFRRLEKLEWTQDSPYHQFDNITLVPSNQTVIDFQSLEHVDNSYMDAGKSYTEDGFIVRQGKNEPHPLATWGTHAAGYAGSTALFNNTAGGLIHLAAADGGDFDLIQMDISKLHATGEACPITFVGTKTDGTQVVQTVTAWKPYNVLLLQTVQFKGFDSLKYVEWTQESPYHQFDNIVAVESVPAECYPDFTADGVLDLFDFLAYVNAFNAGDQGADCDGDGDLTLFDFLCYVNAFNEGC